MLRVTFEGTDGAGKTTGLKYFIERAKENGISVVETREVGNPNVPICVKLRELVLDPSNNLDGRTMEFIFAAMAIENDQWLSKLERSGNSPDMLVSDRGWFSHLSYTDHNVDEEFTHNFYNKFLIEQVLLPHVVIYFSVDTQTALKRRVKRGEGMDAIEIKGVEFQEKVRNSFEKYIEMYGNSAYPMRFHTIDANADLNSVKAQLDDILSKYLPNKKAL